MNVAAESVVRSFLEAWKKPELGELVSFFSDDAVYIDGPRGEHRGIEAIKDEFKTGLTSFPGLNIDIKTLVTDQVTVMVERVDTFEIGGKSFHMEAAGVFEVDDNGRIKRWHDYYDVKSIADQIEAAGSPLPG